MILRVRGESALVLGRSVFARRCPRCGAVVELIHVTTRRQNMHAIPPHNERGRWRTCYG